MDRLIQFAAMTVISMLFGTSWAQDITIYKHILRFRESSEIPLGYIESKYFYQEQSLAYVIRYSDNGWQLYDSVQYTKINNTWYKSTFDVRYQPFRFIYRGEDALQDLFFVNPNVDYVHDAYELLDYLYLNDINALLSNTGLTYMSCWNKTQDTCCYSFLETYNTGLFSNYGISPYDTLASYCFHIDADRTYDWDCFTFSDCIVSRRYDYTKRGNISKVTIEITRSGSKEKYIWIESFYSIHHRQGIIDLDFVY